MSEPNPNAWFDLDAYIAAPRVTGLMLARDDESLVVTVQAPDREVASYETALWRVPTTGQGRPRRLTRGVGSVGAVAPLRDGSVVFTAKRELPPGGESDSDQDQALWCLPAGGEAFVLARRVGGFGPVQIAADSDQLACALSVQRGVDDLTQDAQRRRQREKLKVSAILHEGYPVRYWDHDLDSTTTRFAVLDLPDGAEGDPELGSDELRVVHTDPGAGLAPEAVLSRDGRSLFTSRQVLQQRGIQRSALVRLDLTTGEFTTVRDAEGVDWSPECLSHDGRLLVATRSAFSTAEQVSDRELVLIDLATDTERLIAPGWDRWASAACFNPDGSRLYLTADEDGASPIFAVDLAGGGVTRLTTEGAFSQLQLSSDGSVLFALRTGWTDPGTIVAIKVSTGELTTLRSPVSHPPLPGSLVRVETTASDGVRIPGWLCLPEGADAEHPAPLALWVHGGPVSSWNAWSWRWCPWLLVSRGYAVLLPDPALSTGYGLDFIQRAWGRWGAESYTDIMALTEQVASRPDVDGADAVMMGGSYGGYMANWIAGHTGDRFRAIVSHASLWNLDAFATTTDVCWFWDQEMSAEMRHEYNPRRFVDQITTPMLVIHGDKDYRVPIGEGLGLWWELNQHHQGAAEEFKHRFLYFPNENHWILTPQHAKLWYACVIEFLAAQREGRRFDAPELL